MSNQEKVIPDTLPKFKHLLVSTFSSEIDQAQFFRNLSEQVGTWSLYNFGNQLSHRPAMGMIEELNELQEGFSEFNRAKVMDAIGDITIYMADYYAKRSWDMGHAWEVAVQPAWLQNAKVTHMVSELCKRLAHYHLKGEQGIRGGVEKNDALMRATCQDTLWFLLSVCVYFEVEYLGIISSIWYVVGKRDWRKNKNDANAVADSQVDAERSFGAGGGVAVANLSGVKRLEIDTKDHKNE